MVDGRALRALLRPNGSLWRVRGGGEGFLKVGGGGAWDFSSSLEGGAKDFLSQK